MQGLEVAVGLGFVLLPTHASLLVQQGSGGDASRYQQRVWHGQGDPRSGQCCDPSVDTRGQVLGRAQGVRCYASSCPTLTTHLVCALHNSVWRACWFAPLSSSGRLLRATQKYRESQVLSTCPHFFKALCFCITVSRSIDHVCTALGELQNAQCTLCDLPQNRFDGSLGRVPISFDTGRQMFVEAQDSRAAGAPMGRYVATATTTVCAPPLLCALSSPSAKPHCQHTSPAAAATRGVHSCACTGVQVSPGMAQIQQALPQPLTASSSAGAARVSPVVPSPKDFLSAVAHVVAPSLTPSALAVSSVTPAAPATAAPSGTSATTATSTATRGKRSAAAATGTSFAAKQKSASKRSLKKAAAPAVDIADSYASPSAAAAAAATPVSSLVVEASGAGSWVHELEAALMSLPHPTVPAYPASGGGSGGARDGSMTTGPHRLPVSTWPDDEIIMS